MLEDQADTTDAAPGSADPGPTTGVASVDEVVRGLRDLDDLPVDEHVGVYESAHAALRRTLDQPPAPDGD